MGSGGRGRRWRGKKRGKRGDRYQADLRLKDYRSELPLPPLRRSPAPLTSG
jgi:hypothetical protein